MLILFSVQLLVGWEIPVVAPEQCLLVVFDEVNLAPNLKSFARLEAAQPKITVQTADHALKQFLIRLECGGKNHRAVRAVAADQPVAGHGRV